MTDKVQDIFTDHIHDPKDPMRSELGREELFELADNIKQNGLINPITVRPIRKVAGGASEADIFEVGFSASPDEQLYEVVAGHRRLAACRIAGKIRIACVVRELTDKQTFAVMAAENLERAEVDPVDEAIFIERYMRQTGATAAETAKELRRSVTFVETRLVIGQMPDYMKTHLKAGTLKIGVALALARITDDDIRRYWVDLAARDGVSVAMAEYWVTGWEMNKSAGGAPVSNPPDGYEPSAPPVVKFRCAIDGNEYPASAFKPVMIYEGNLDLFYAFVKAYNTPPSEPVSVSSATPPPPTA